MLDYGGLSSDLSSELASSAFSASFRYFLRAFFAALSYRFFLTSPIIAVLLLSPLNISSSLAARSSLAVLRFWSRERVAWHLTTVPVGMCFSWTAELVLFLSILGQLLNTRPAEEGPKTYNLLAAWAAALEEALFNFLLWRRLWARGHLLCELGCCCDKRRSQPRSRAKH